MEENKKAAQRNLCRKKFDGAFYASQITLTTKDSKVIVISIRRETEHGYIPQKIVFIIKILPISTLFFPKTICICYNVFDYSLRRFLWTLLS